MARLDPQLRLYPEGGQVVVTRFECPSLLVLAVIRLRHATMHRHVRRSATGFLGISTTTDWNRRVLLSLSLWQSLDCIYSMGMVPEHINATRLPARLGVRTTCGIFCLAGDWRTVMFGGAAVLRSPLFPLASPPPAGDKEKEPDHGQRN